VKPAAPTVSYEVEYPDDEEVGSRLQIGGPWAALYIHILVYVFVVIDQFSYFN